MNQPAASFNFAPYTPPPDSVSSIREANASYQSGAIPTFAATSTHAERSANAQVNLWESAYGLRVDILAALAYVLGPITALLLLIVETQNDFVRFHAYQSALVTTPLLTVIIVASLLKAPSWIQMLCTFFLVLVSLYMAARTYIDVAHNGIAHRRLPMIGALADRWVEDE